MPELPEVETSRRGIEPYLVGHNIQYAVVRNARLRWPVSEQNPGAERSAGTQRTAPCQVFADRVGPWLDYRTSGDVWQLTYAGRGNRAR